MTLTLTLTGQENWRRSRHVSSVAVVGSIDNGSRANEAYLVDTDYRGQSQRMVIVLTRFKKFSLIRFCQISLIIKTNYEMHKNTVRI